MPSDETKRVTPKLRFPMFEESGDWRTKPLGGIAEIINDRVGDEDCTPYTITSGVGLVSQEEKLGRTIAGQSLRNYYRLKTDDFAYNKSATKAYPEGYIARFTGDDAAGVPSSIFTCFRLNDGDVRPDYLDFLFQGNHHGRWLQKFITVGARAHGALSVSDGDLLSLPIPLPPDPTSEAEQRKIADCLSSLDAAVAAQGRKLEALRAHKRGLMQALFPREGQTRPRLRFPQFRNAGDWATKKIADVFDTATGGTPDRNNKAYWNGGIPWVTTSLVDFNIIVATEESISPAGLQNSSAKMFPKGTILMALYGQGKTRGKVAMLGIEATTNQACAAILPSGKVDQWFAFLNLSGRYDEIRALSNAGGQENLSQGLLRELPFCYPKDPAEQKHIAASLSSLDALIAAASAKLAALQTHKKALIQQLFPPPTQH